MSGIYWFRRTVRVIPVFFGVTVLVFFLLRLAPGDAARIRLQETGYDLSEEALTRTRTALGLDKPIPVQYGLWLRDLFRLDLGSSLITGQPVSTELVRHFRMTMLLALPVMASVIVIAFPLGLISAMYQDTFWDRIISFGTIAALAIPSFCLGLLWILLFSVRLRWLPSFGAETAAHLIMPWLTLLIPSAAHYTRFIRTVFLEEFAKEYIRAARSRGAGVRDLVWAHAMKNALIPIITALGMSLALMLGGSVVAEKVFSIPGIGKYLIDAVLRRDYPAVQGCVLLFAFLFTLINLLADLLCMALDPKLRRSQIR